MLVKLNKEVEETFEIVTPCWFHQRSPERWHFINEKGDLATVGAAILVIWKAEDGNGPAINAALTGAHACGEYDFKDALDRLFKKTEETVAA